MYRILLYIQFFTQSYEKVIIIINYYPLFTGEENKASGAGDSAHDGSSRKRQNWSGSGHILKGKPKTYPDEYDRDLGGRKIKADLMIWGLSIWSKRRQERETGLGDPKDLAVDMLSLRCWLDSRCRLGM